ncbi:MAG TPA: phosphotransferase [Acidimicrobiales bacterium]|nr:phosphotransferase [Acidimicrobiales bacterium]
MRHDERIASAIDRARLSAWGTVELLDRASGGARNEVWFALVNGERCVLRKSTRSPAALAWELDLVDAVRSIGLGAPAVVRTASGARTRGGVVVYRAMAGEPPRNAGDWRAVTRYLSTLHAAFPSPQQRPDFLSACDLLSVETGGDVDFSAMPAEAVKRCRSAWARVCEQPRSIVHGDPGKRNILMTEDGVVLLDWDEARVDVPVFDLAALPPEVSPLSEWERWVAAQAANAWEAAVSWRPEPEYARRRLSEVTA